MIIESAFYKLPDYFLTEDKPQLSSEGQLVSYFSLAIFLELQNRGVPNSFLNIQLEKRYPTRKRAWADIFVKIPWLEGLPPESNKILTANYYHIFKENWIEVKFFGGIGRERGTRKKTYNVRIIIDELLRLRFYTSSNSGRYLLIGFNRKPQEYLAFSKRREERGYLKEMLQTGEHKIEFNLTNEPKVFKEKILSNWKNELNLKGSKNINSLPIKFELLVSTLKIEPKGAFTLPDRPCFWLYLIKVLPQPDEMRI
jgi:hypothetical protein